MKTNILQWCVAGAAAGGLALATGCRENKATTEVPTLIAAPTVAQPASAATPTPAEAPPKPAAPAEVLAPPAETEAPPVAAVPVPQPTRAPIIITNPHPANATAAAPPAATTNAPVEVVMEPTVPDELTISPALAEMVKMIQSGLAEEVLTSYVTNSTEPFYVGADQIVYLKDIGASPTLITTLLSHESRPEIAQKRKAAAAVGPLPAGMAVNEPVRNVYPGQTQPVAVGSEPTPVNTTAEAAPPPPPAEDTEVTEAGTLPPDEPVTDVSYFYSSLAPYGTWVSVPDYGYCWRPTVAVYDPYWAPYRDCGRWLWSDCGWYWYSDYTWGWAPFHYGRWCTYPGYGWVWRPGTCWGPAWVTWRYNSAYCGWAPLPPACGYSFGVGLTFGSGPVGVSFGFGLPASCYTFVGWNHFCSARPGPYYVSPAYAHRIYKDTTAINNYVVRNNNVIINKGVGTDRISGPIPKATIRETTPSGSKIVTASVRRETLHSDGTLRVDRPNLTATGTSAPRSSFRSTPAATAGRSTRPSGATSTRPPASVRTYPTSGSASSRPIVTGATAASGTRTTPRGAATLPSSRFNATPRAATRSAPRTTPNSRTGPTVYPGSSYSTRPATSPSATTSPSTRSRPSTPATAGSRGASTLRPSRAPSNPSVRSRPSSSVTRPTRSARNVPSSVSRSPSVRSTQPRRVTPSAAPSYRQTRPAPSYRAPSRPSPSQSFRAPTRSAPSYRAPQSAPSYRAPSAPTPRFTPRSAPSSSPRSVRSAPSYSAPGGRSTPSQGRFSR